MPSPEFVLIVLPTNFLKVFPSKSTKVLQVRSISIWMMLSSEYLLLKSSYPSRYLVVRAKHQSVLSTVYENEGFLYNTF